MAAACTTENFCVKYAVSDMTMMASMIPPMVPSHVFLGEIEDNGVLPIKEPTIYAIVSFTHKVKMIIRGMIILKSTLASIQWLRKSINNARGNEIYRIPKSEYPVVNKKDLGD